MRESSLKVSDYLCFTARELELLRLFVEQGKCTKEAAWDLHISSKTAETHRANIMRKLRKILGYDEMQPLSAVDLTLFAVANGLVNMKEIERRYQKIAIPSPS